MVSGSVTLGSGTAAASGLANAAPKRPIASIATTAREGSSKQIQPSAS
ncbi:hypothetical protein ACFQU2_29490 [Siccirubricoccus deserti]